MLFVFRKYPASILVPKKIMHTTTAGKKIKHVQWAGKKLITRKKICIHPYRVHVRVAFTKSTPPSRLSHRSRMVHSLRPDQTSKCTWDELNCNLSQSKRVKLGRWVKCWTYHNSNLDQILIYPSEAVQSNELSWVKRPSYHKLNSLSSVTLVWTSTSDLGFTSQTKGGTRPGVWGAWSWLPGPPSIRKLKVIPDARKYSYGLGRSDGKLEVSHPPS